MQELLIRLAVSPIGMRTAAILQDNTIVGPGGTGSGGGGGSLGGGANYYVPWSPDMLYAGIQDLLSKLGTATNVGFWIFLVVTGVYMVIKVADGLGR